MTGFVVDDKKSVGPPGRCRGREDGSLFVTEDGSGTIWRVTHQRQAAGNPPPRTPATPAPCRSA